MTYRLDQDEAGFMPTDRILIDGISCRFIAHSAQGFLFVSDDDAQTVIEIAATDLAEMLGTPGRLQVEPEYFKKKGSRK